MADKLNGIFISEILSDNAGGNAVDVDGDGNTNKSDEFIELQNSSGAAVSLNGYQLWSEKNGLLFSFGASDTIDPGDTATVVGNYSGSVPTGYYDAGISEGSNWLPDGEGQKFDTIFLVDASTGDFVAFSYGQPPRTPTFPTNFTGTNQIGAGESINSNAPNGVAFSRDINGDMQQSTPTPDTPGVPCFLKGTRITTLRGQVPVEGLAPGDMVLTKDAGFRPLLAVGHFCPSRFDILRDGDLAPVRFPQGSVGNARDLLVSGSHRVLLKASYAELLFGQSEVLASARQCIGLHGVQVVTRRLPIAYYHLVFEAHEIIAAEGSWVESLFLGAVARQAASQSEHWCVAPGLDLVKVVHSRTARVTLKQFEAQLLFEHAASQSALNRSLAA